MCASVRERLIKGGREGVCVCICVCVCECVYIIYVYIKFVRMSVCRRLLVEGRKKYIMLCECDHSKHRNCVWRDREWIRLRERERNNEEETSNFSLKCLWIFKF
jgi:hypothetical protein